MKFTAGKPGHGGEQAVGTRPGHGGERTVGTRPGHGGSTQWEQGQVMAGLVRSVMFSDAVAQSLALCPPGQASKPLKREEDYVPRQKHG